MFLSFAFTTQPDVNTSLWRGLWNPALLLLWSEVVFPLRSSPAWLWWHSRRRPMGVWSTLSSPCSVPGKCCFILPSTLLPPEHTRQARQNAAVKNRKRCCLQIKRHDVSPSAAKYNYKKKKTRRASLTETLIIQIRSLLKFEQSHNYGDLLHVILFKSEAVFKWMWRL